MLSPIHFIYTIKLFRVKDSMKAPTQADVARIAGVSRATVSYVLNDQVAQRIPISPETRQRVLDVIAELDYEPDARAQSLRRGSTKTIGVLIPLYENPHFWQILRGISSEAEASGYSVLLSHNTLTPEQERHSLRELAQQRVDGLILLIGFKYLPPGIIDQLRKAGRPIVEMSSTGSEFDHVFTSYSEGTRALLQYLFELGHQRIGFVYGVQMEAQGYDRLLMYRQAMQDAGLLDESLIQNCGPVMEDGYQAALKLLSQPNRPTAVLVINDLLAMTVVRAATDLGLNVPNDISVASFDDIPFSSYTLPRLTTVSGQPVTDGQNAVRLLLRRLNEPNSPREVLTGAWQLKVRESTGPIPMEVKGAVSSQEHT
jgi:LacI family transcriptional regulator